MYSHSHTLAGNPFCILHISLFNFFDTENRAAPWRMQQKNAKHNIHHRMLTVLGVCVRMCVCCNNNYLLVCARVCVFVCECKSFWRNGTEVAGGQRK